jgi:hypothetical protein
MLRSGGSERMTPEMRTRTSGSSRTTRTTRASRTSRSRVELSRTPGMYAAVMTTKSKTFQPLRKKSCGRRP